jgi:membrane-bound metal-dependent hydrolase YbcI (DUF457 family)
VLLWFVGTSIVTIALVFRDPRFDYRPLVVGSLVPDVVDALLGGARYAHSLTVSVALLALVMLATSGRRPIRRVLLGVPIGMLLHLVFDGAFNDTRVFWWPFTGSIGHERLPVAQRGWLDVLLELIGAGLIAWIVVRAGLRDPERRRRAWRTGELDGLSRP